MSFPKGHMTGQIVTHKPISLFVLTLLATSFTVVAFEGCCLAAPERSSVEFASAPFRPHCEIHRNSPLFSPNTNLDRATKGTDILWETHQPTCRKSLSPAFVRTFNSSSSTPTRPRRGTSSRPSNSRSASRTTTPSVTSVSREPSSSPRFPVLVSR